MTNEYKICDKEFVGKNVKDGFNYHLKHVHKQTRKEYFDLYLKKLSKR